MPRRTGQRCDLGTGSADEAAPADVDITSEGLTSSAVEAATGEAEDAAPKVANAPRTP